MLVYYHNYSSQAVQLQAISNTNGVRLCTFRVQSGTGNVPVDLPGRDYSLRVITSSYTNTWSILTYPEHCDLTSVEAPVAGGQLLLVTPRHRATVLLDGVATEKVIYGGVFLLCGLVIARCWQSAGKS